MKEMQDNILVLWQGKKSNDLDSRLVRQVTSVFTDVTFIYSCVSHVVCPCRGSAFQCDGFEMWWALQDVIVSCRDSCHFLWNGIVNHPKTGLWESLWPLSLPSALCAYSAFQAHWAGNSTKPSPETEQIQCPTLDFQAPH